MVDDYKRQKRGEMTDEEFQSYLNMMKRTKVWFRNTFGHMSSTTLGFGYWCALGHVDEISDTLFQHTIGRGKYSADVDSGQVRKLEDGRLEVVAVIDRKTNIEAVQRELPYAAKPLYEAVRRGSYSKYDKAMAPIYIIGRNPEFTEFYIREYPDTSVQRLDRAQYQKFVQDLQRKKI